MLGIDPNNATIKITGPDGEEIEHGSLVITGHDGSLVISKPDGGWEMGEYVIVVSAADRLGHVCPITKTVRVENPMLTLTDAYSYPNPFDPADGDVALHFVLGKTSDVTIKIFDFAGNFVTTLMTQAAHDWRRLTSTGAARHLTGRSWRTAPTSPGLPQATVLGPKSRISRWSSGGSSGSMVGGRIPSPNLRCLLKVCDDGFNKEEVPKWQDGSGEQS